MIVDLHDIPPGARLEATVCIVGGGPAGITLALALADRGIDCCILESGGEGFEKGPHALSEAEQVGLADVQSCRQRMLGGASNHWGGYCAQLEPDDFERRDWVEYSGWPLNFETLASYYPKAQEACRLEPATYRVSDVGDMPAEYSAFDAHMLVTRLYQMSKPPLRFAAAYRDRLLRDPRIVVYLSANVTALETGAEGGPIESARVRSLGGWEGQAFGRCFVLAGGAIENARLLLLPGESRRRGLGNDHDNVGRFFMQHPHLADTRLLMVDAPAVERMFKPFESGGTTYRASVGPNVAVRRRERILNCSATVHTVPDAGSGYAALHELRRDMVRGEWPDELAEKLWAILTDADRIVDRLSRGPRLATLYLRSEQAPDRDSRVTLSERRDSLGVPLCKVEWRLAEIDKRTLRKSALSIGRELGRLRLARVRLPAWLLDDEGAWPDSLWGGCHHIGTTRMSDHPRTGVVDPDCRVRGTPNLFVAGSSVFPTGGYANPTLTILALCLRLADHLSGRLRV